jgi:hypothetical protein
MFPAPPSAEADIHASPADNAPAPASTTTTVSPIFPKVSFNDTDDGEPANARVSEKDFDPTLEDANANAWSYKAWLRTYEEDAHAKNIKKKRMALTWDRLEVIGIESSAVLGDDVLSYINPLEYIRNASGKNTTV